MEPFGTFQQAFVVLGLPGFQALLVHMIQITTLKSLYFQQTRGPKTQTPDIIHSGATLPTTRAKMALAVSHFRVSVCMMLVMNTMHDDRCLIQNRHI